MAKMNDPIQGKTTVMERRVMQEKRLMKEKMMMKSLVRTTVELTRNIAVSGRRKMLTGPTSPRTSTSTTVTFSGLPTRNKEKRTVTWKEENIDWANFSKNFDKYYGHLPGLKE
jgi:hypothetical protein